MKLFLLEPKKRGDKRFVKNCVIGQLIVAESPTNARRIAQEHGGDEIYFSDKHVGVIIWLAPEDISCFYLGEAEENLGKEEKLLLRSWL